MMTKEELEKDFIPFADPATDVVIKETDDHKNFIIKMVFNGDPLDLRIDGISRVVVKDNNARAKYESLKSFIAKEFIDLSTIKETQRRIYGLRNEKAYIEPDGIIIDDTNKREFTDINDVSQVVLPRNDYLDENEQILNIVLLDGPAGIGKTQLIRKLILQRVSQGLLGIPILHVQNKGAFLSSLQPNIAQAIQDLRGNFTYHQVPVLIRHGLLQLAIDGFDELVDPSGYKDAWAALSDFIETTRFGGPIILAGRDTFFDKLSFEEQLRKWSRKARIVHIRLDLIAPQKAVDWLINQGWKKQHIYDKTNKPFVSERPFLLRPFFLNILAGVEDKESILEGKLFLPDYLIGEFLDREVDKLSLSSSDEENRVFKRLYGQMMSLIALDMAISERDYVDSSYVKFVVELVFDNHVSKDVLHTLIHKSLSFALLEKSEGNVDLRKFPHSEIFHYFLAKEVLNAFIENKDNNNIEVFIFLRRGMIYGDFLRTFQELFQQQSADESKLVVHNLEMLLTHEVSYDQMRYNSGALLLATLGKDVGRTDRNYQSLEVNEVVLSTVDRPVVLRQCTIFRLDARDENLELLEFYDVSVSILVVNEASRFGKHIPIVNRLQLHKPEGIIMLYDSDEIARWLTVHSTSDEILRQCNVEAVMLLDRTCRRIVKQYYIWLHEEDQYGAKLLKSILWPKIEEILEGKGKITRKPAIKDEKGTFLMHIVNAQYIVERRDDDKDTQEILAQVCALE